MRHTCQRDRGRQRGINGRERPAPGLCLALALLLTGCLPITTQVSPGTEERRAGILQPFGTPVATMTPHPDQEGWTVTVMQPVRRPVEVIRTVRQTSRYLYLNPLSIPIGAVSCASGLWAVGFTLLTPHAPAHKRQELLEATRDGCLMAVMINQSENKDGHTRTVLEQQEETETRPFVEGRMTLEWHGPQSLAVSYPLASDGRAIIRLDHLVTAIRQTGSRLDVDGATPIELVLWHEQRRLAHWPVQVSRQALQAASRHERPTMAPLTQWPIPFIARVIIEDPFASRRSVEAQFIRTLLDHGASVVAPEDAHGLLQHEIQTSLQGFVDDQAAVSPGHWLAPTVLVVVRMGREPQAATVMVEMLDVRTRAVLAEFAIPAGPTEKTVALDVALLRTAELVRSIVKRDRHDKD